MIGRRSWGLLLALAILAASCVFAWTLLGPEGPWETSSPDRAATAGRDERPAGRPGDEARHPSGRLVATGRKEPPAANAMTACLGRQGWEAVPYGGTKRGYVPHRPVPPEGQLGFLKAERYCADRTGRTEPEKPDTADLEKLYADVVATKRCLEEQGYLVVETPSRAEFVEVRGAWDPYASLVAPDLGYIGDGEYVRLNRLCPNPLPR